LTRDERYRVQERQGRVACQGQSPPPCLLTIDVEDWYQLSGQQLTGMGRARPGILERQLNSLLQLLANHGRKATFFCLGISLHDCPHLIKRIQQAGHEIASHGWAHQPIHQTGLDAFRTDLKRSIDWLQQVTGRRILGYRAPAFSVAPEQLEGFFDVCFDAGLTYDSSVFPIRGRRYGIEHASRGPAVVRDAGGRRLIELPLATVRCFGRARAVAGGGHWRMMPIRLINAALRRIGDEGLPAVTYLHNYEFDRRHLDAQLAAGPASSAACRTAALHGIRQNLGRSAMHRKLDSLLRRHRFSTIEDYLRDAGCA